MTPIDSSPLGDGSNHLDSGEEMRLFDAATRKIPMERGGIGMDLEKPDTDGWRPRCAPTGLSLYTFRRSEVDLRKMTDGQCLNR